MSLAVIMLLYGMLDYFFEGLTSFSDMTEEIWLSVLGALSLSLIGDSSFLFLKPAE